MARPQLQGLKYFPFDVGFFRDKKIKLLRGEHGADGVEIYQRLLCQIYEDNGYYLTWNDSEDYALLADETGYSEERIRLIVSTCFKRSLFNDKLFKAGNVLTSRSIQRRYFSAIQETKTKAAASGRHILIQEDLCLLTGDEISQLNKTRVWLKVAYENDNSPINESYSPINEGNSPINPAKETKLNKTKLNKTNVVIEPPDTGEQALIKYFINNIHATAGKDLIDELCSWQDVFPAEVIIRAIKEAVDGGNDKRNYKYISAILRNWQRMELFSLSLVESYLTAWKKKAEKNTKALAKPKEKTRFHNYEQHARDYSAIEKLEHEYLVKLSQGGNS